MCIRDSINGVRDEYEKEMDTFALQNGLAAIFKVLGRANKYIDETAPWILGKDESKKDRLASVLFNLTEAIRVSAILLSPFMPATSEKMLASLGCEDVYKRQHPSRTLIPLKVQS